MEKITAGEMQLLEQFRERVHNEFSACISSRPNADKNLYLLQWLRAGGLNLEKAIKMFRSSMKWRQQVHADNVLEMEVESGIKAHMPIIFKGRDKLGHPIALIPLSEWDFRKVKTDPRSSIEFEKLLVQYLETTKSKIWSEHVKRKPGSPPITLATVIIDMTDYAYGQLANFGSMKRVYQFTNMYENNYPGTVYKIFFINCPSYLNILFKILKPALAASTVERFMCYSSMSEWKKDIGKYFDPSALPERYGGTGDD